uniref:G-protein coupled receptors family 1 profile domain-containing protein n=1 Tax=Romanomermis culicivorax TaxID=13658 RepID=A0A915JSN5_ROMCU
FNITDDYYNWKNNFSKNNNRNSSSNEISYEFFNIFKERSSTILTAHWICFGLGSAAVFINLYLMVSIMINRKTLIKNVFYALVLHCAFVDLMRSAALIIWCLPGLRLVDFAAFATVKQLLLIVLRSLNLLTALNLLVFTVNEYVLVSKPLHYKRVIRRRLIAILIGLSWILSLTFVLGGVFAQSFTPGIQQVYILSEKEGNKNKNDDHLNETYGSKIAGYDDEDENEDNMKLAESGVKGGDFDDGEFFHNFHSSRNINGTFSRNFSGIFDWNETSKILDDS